MATDKPISGLPTVASIADTDLFTSVRPGDPTGTKNKQNLASQVKDYISAKAKQETFIPTLGQTIFTLAQTPSGTDAFGFYLNGQLRQNPTDYTFTGTTLTWNDPGGLTLKTTDELIAWYDFTASGAFSLSQAQVYYVGDAGNDGSNNGRSVEFPFLTIGAAITAILAQTPSATNRFEIQVIGAPNSTVGTITLPDYASLIHRSGQIDGSIALGQESKFAFNKLVIAGSATGIIANGKTAYIEGKNITTSGTDAIGLSLTNSTVYSYIENSDLSSSDSKTYDLSTNSTLYLTGIKSREDIVSTKDGTSSVFIDWQDYSTAQHTIIFNEKGNIDLDAKGQNIILRDSANGQIFTNINQFPRFPNLPAVVASVSSPIVGLTGDNTNATVIFNYKDLDNAGNYNNGTGVFTSPVKGMYSINVVLFLEGLTINNYDLRIQVYSASQSPTILWLNPDALATPTQPDKIILNGSVDLLLLQNETIEIRLEVDGEISKNVDVGVPSYFNCKLVTAVS